MAAPLADVAGKTAFITGGASGVGLGMAKVFANAGMKVVIADIREKALDEAMAGFADTGAKVHPVKLDVMDRAGFACAADEAERAFGPVHLLCNNAGINLFAAIDECTYDDWDWVLGVNLDGVVNGIVTFVPRMKAHGEGAQIVNTASMAAFITSAGAGIYTGAKFAVRGLSESLRWSLADKNIGVSVLCPGLVNTAIHDSNSIRPRELSRETAKVDESFMQRLPEVHKLGMDPILVGERSLAGIRRNDLYIFTHPEFKDEVKTVFDEVLRAFPEPTAEDLSAPRMTFENFRKEMALKAREKK
jgi:NAD(P)-dependent dehydrogenase (short-subunit alcohol dehydrogenase family)